MRLIDADTLEKLMTEDWFLEILATQHSKNSIKKDIENAIDSVPLAYDVEKVVEQLTEMEDKAMKVKNITVSSYACGMMHKAIDIVKKGGVE